MEVYLKRAVLDKSLRVDQKYFKEADYGFCYSQFFMYKLAQQAKEFYKQKILTLDSDEANPIYTTYATKDVIEDEQTNLNKSKYAKQFEELDKIWVKYREQHKNEFIEQERIDSSDEITQSIKVMFNPSANLVSSLKEMWESYQIANLFLKEKFGDKSSDAYLSLPKYTTLVSKDDSKEKHKEFKNKQREILGIPVEEDLIVKVPTKIHMIRRSKKAEIASLPDITDSLKEFTIEFEKFLLNR